uniref:Sperm associated antigen 1a n=1 Tax=Lepisosteus oculatus TaxID=7918 RepID=W5MU10_LEPOC|nr:PREDICTED: sperm-associated antigen 1 isoform X1 [Lepisosteus oculatus]
MSTEQVSSLLGPGETKSTQVPIEHLDYGFIQNCADVKHLGRILRVLRSGQEGFYPHLIDFCEKRIEKLDPKSRALRKDQPPATAASLPAGDWAEIAEDLKNWENEVKQNEAEMKHLSVLHDAENVPLVRGSNFCVASNQSKATDGRSKTKKRAVPLDYREWDKFDADKECSKIDGNVKEEFSSAVINHGLPKVKRQIDTRALTEKEKQLLANREKDKGNEAFKAKDYEEAVVYYTRSLSVMPTVAAYNNRAQAEINLQNWNNAFHDCQKALELEPNNLKALLRRATVYKHQGNYKAAVDDLRNVLRAEPHNLIAKNLLCEAEEKVKDGESGPQPRGKRIVIEEVDESEEQGEEAEGSLHVGGETASPAVKGEMGNANKKFPGRGDGGPRMETKTSPAPQKEKSKGASGETSRAQGDSKSADQGLVNGAQENGSCVGDQSSSGAPGTDSSRPDVISGALTPELAKLKSQGNELFKNGQFSDALNKYTQAIGGFIEAGIDSAEDLSILYSNRAACHLKDGNSLECIQDCKRALELQPFSIKPLLRRAMAYESLENYRQAYVDYKTVLQIDRGVQAASDSANRISRLLIAQDGHAWRENLPTIPVVPLSSQQHRWQEPLPRSEQTPGTGQVSDSAGAPQDTGEKADALFLSLKQEGNDFVKKSQYRAGLGKYSECLKIKPEECAIYTNRALCYLKLDQFAEAKQDCDSALQLEPSNKKAFYRRALAYKGLQDYAACSADLQELLRLDPSVQEAERELQEVTGLLKQQHLSASPQDKHRRNVPIQEVNDNEETESTEHRTSEIDREEMNNTVEVEHTFTLEPTNAYEFGQALNAARAKGDVATCAELLCSVEPEKLPSFMSNKLDGDVFTFIIQALDEHLLQEDPIAVYHHLNHLHKAERFKVVLLLLSKNERQKVNQLFEHLSMVEKQGFTTYDVQNLANKYIVS